jgi:hypothetical protein
MRLSTTDRHSANRGRRPSLLAIFYAAYYLVAASAIFLTARHIQGMELPAFSNIVLKLANELNSPAITMILPPSGASSAETMLYLLAVVMLLPLAAVASYLRCLKRGEASTMASYEGS